MSSPHRPSIRRTAIIPSSPKGPTTVQQEQDGTGRVHRRSITRSSIYDVSKKLSSDGNGNGSGSATTTTMKPRPSLSQFSFNKSSFSPDTSTANTNSSNRNMSRFKSRRNLFASDESKDDFHKACLTYTDIKELRQLFHACWSTDKAGVCTKADPVTGRLPLHCIGLNQNLVLSPRHAPRVEQFILEELIPTHLDSIVTEDDDHQIPFTEVIHDWVRSRRALRSWQSFRTTNTKSAKDKLRSIAKEISTRSKLTKQQSNDDDGATDEEKDDDSLGDLVTQDKDDDDKEDTSDLPPIVEWSLRILSSVLDETLTSRRLGSGFAGGTNNNNNLEDTGQESALFDEDGSDTASSTAHKSLQGHLKEISNNLVQEVAAIPHIVEELLLIEDKEARSRVFELSIVHKVLFTPTSLGDGKWLIRLLSDGIKTNKTSFINATNNQTTKRKADGAGRIAMTLQQLEAFSHEETLHEIQKDEAYTHAEAAIFYLEAISTLDARDDLNIDARGHHHRHYNHVGSSVAQRQFQKHKGELFEIVGALEGLVRHIAVLKDDLVTRAAITPVIQQLLDRKIFCPFALTVAFFEGIQHILMIVCFRFGPSTGLFHLSPLDTGFPPQKYLVSNMVLVSCIVFFFLKETHRGIAKYTLSRRLFWHDMYSFWNLVDIVPIFMVTVCMIAVDSKLRHRALVEHDPTEYGTIPFYLRVAIALTTPFLWLRVLSHIKMQNKQLATFILCSVEIMKDIKWFLLVLFIAMSGFAQMYVSLTGEPHTLQTSAQSSAFDGYLKAYTIMLGDLETSSLQSHPIITVLFIFYTFGVTVVLLNILIAIVSDSYEKSMVSANSMLAKARLMFVARLLSVNFFHRLWRQGKTGNTRRNLNIVAFIFGAVTSKMIVSTVKAKLGRLGQESIFGSKQTLSTGDSSTNSSGWGMGQLDVEAFFIFILVSGVVIIMRVTLIVVQNVGDDHKGESDRIKLEPKEPSLLDHYIGELYAFLGTQIDVLGDDADDNKYEDLNAIGAKQDRYEIVKMRRAIATSRNELKTELKNTTQQLRLAMDESEVRTTDDLTELSEDLTAELNAHKKEMKSLIKESEERIISAIAKKLDERAAF